MIKCKLGEIAQSQTGPFGSQLHEQDYVIEGTPIVTVEHLGDVGFTMQNLPCVSGEDTVRLSKYKLEEGDIVFSRVGSVDRCVYTQKEQEGWLFSGRCLRVRCNEEKVNARYLSYYFKLAEFKKMMSNVSVGATMPSLNTDLMNSVELILLEREKQDKVAELLDAIDSKINCNNKINVELESMAKTIYDYWFLQFDFPGENGKPYKSSGGKMVWNEELKREIPEGWEVRKLFDAMDVIYGYPLSTKLFTSQEGIPIVRIRDILYNSSSAFTTEQVNKKYLSKSKDLLIGMDGNFHMNFWARDGECVNQRIVRIRNKDVCVLQVYFELTPYIKAKEQNVARSTVGHLSDKDLKSLNILIPNQKEIYECFDEILEKICNIKKENQELISLRDFLLPLLMNDQIGFK